MFKISDFAKLSRVTMKALHYYDEVGVLKPAYIEPSTGYRYYSIDQLSRLHRILALKDLGFSLKQIQLLLDDTLTVEQLRGMLKLRLSELHDHLMQTQAQYERAAAWLTLMEQEDTMSQYEVLLKPVAALTIVSAREVVPTPEQMRERCIALADKVDAFLRRNNIKGHLPSLALYHDANEQGIDVEMAVQLPASINLTAQDDSVQVYTLPAVPTMASLIYQGSYDDFAAVGAAHAALGKWIEHNGYTITGPNREWYLRVPRLGSGDPSGIMELQFPVRKQS